MYNNDYERTIKYYLRMYSEWKVYCENLQRRMDDINARLKLTAAPKTTKYEFTSGSGGGWDKLSPEEAAVIKRDEDRAMLQNLCAEHQKYRTVLDCIDDCLQQLSPDEKDVVDYRGIRGDSWLSVSMRTNRSESACRAHFRRGIRKMTGMYFGPKAYPEQGSLFLPGEYLEQKNKSGF